MRSIAPAEELVYEWTAEYAGVWMSHRGTAPTLHHIANGMYGMVIVEPSGGLPPVDNEFASSRASSTWGPRASRATLPRRSGRAGPDFVVFNGVANQYLDTPIEVGTGEPEPFFVLDTGPSIDSPFHIVGTIFDTVIREGVSLTRGTGSWGSQAMDLARRRAASSSSRPPRTVYPVVTHAFNLVGRGALGLVQAGDGDPTD